LDVEKPDLVILTGDQLHHDIPDSQSALFKVVAPIIERSIPFAAVFGNHDSEGIHALSWIRTVKYRARYTIPIMTLSSKAKLTGSRTLAKHNENLTSDAHAAYSLDSQVILGDYEPRSNDGNRPSPMVLSGSCKQWTLVENGVLHIDFSCLAGLTDPRAAI